MFPAYSKSKYQAQKSTRRICDRENCSKRKLKIIRKYFQQFFTLYLTFASKSWCDFNIDNKVGEEWERWALFWICHWLFFSETINWENFLKCFSLCSHSAICNFELCLNFLYCARFEILFSKTKYSSQRCLSVDGFRIFHI